MRLYRPSQNSTRNLNNIFRDKHFRNGSKTKIELAVLSFAIVKRLFTLILLIGIVNCYLPLYAGSRSDPDYLIDAWETQQGMPDNSGTAIVQTPEGYLWI